MDTTLDVNEPKPGDKITIISRDENENPVAEKIMMVRVRCYDSKKAIWDVKVYNPQTREWIDREIEVEWPWR